MTLATHTHRHDGQALIHAHEDIGPHTYFTHPEDPPVTMDDLYQLSKELIAAAYQADVTDEDYDIARLDQLQERYDDLADRLGVCHTADCFRPVERYAACKVHRASDLTDD